MNNKKTLIITLVAAAVAVGAAIAAIIVFREQIKTLVSRLPKPTLRPKEYDDYADVDVEAEPEAAAEPDVAV